MASAWGIAFGVAWGVSWGGISPPLALEQPAITTAGGGGKRIHNNEFIIHKHDPVPYIYPFKRNMEAQDRKDIMDILAMLEDSDLLS